MALILAVPLACSSVPPLPEGPSPYGLGREAQLASSEGRHADAGRLFDQAADAFRRAADTDQEILARVDAGINHLAAGRQDQAWRAFSEARAGAEQRTRATWYPVVWLHVNSGLGDLDLLAGRLENARLHYQDALEVAQAGARDTIHYRLAVVAVRQGLTHEAALLEARIVDKDSAEVQAVARALGAAPPRSLVGPVRAAPPPPGAASRFPYLNRLAWSARPSRTNWDPMGKPYRITVHHTGEYFSSTSQREASSMLQKIQRHHQDTNGWADIGYHFLIDPSGRIWQGRAADHQGAHAGNSYLNRGNLGIALLGNFSEQRVTQAQQDALINLLTSLMTTLRIPASRVYSHQDVPGRTAATECPGTALQRAMPGILSRVERRMVQERQDARRHSPSSGLLASKPN